MPSSFGKRALKGSLVCLEARVITRLRSSLESSESAMIIWDTMCPPKLTLDLIRNTHTHTKRLKKPGSEKLGGLPASIIKIFKHTLKRCDDHKMRLRTKH